LVIEGTSGYRELVGSRVKPCGIGIPPFNPLDMGYFKGRTDCGVIQSPGVGKVDDPGVKGDERGFGKLSADV